MSFGVPVASSVAERGSRTRASPFGRVVPTRLSPAVTTTPPAGLDLPWPVNRSTFTVNGSPGFADGGAFSTSSVGPDAGSEPDVKYHRMRSPFWTGVRLAPVDETT